jgi:hypothetical protein
MRLRAQVVSFLGVAGLAAALSPQCTSKQYAAMAPHRNVWQPLSDQETSTITNFLNQTFNLTSTTYGFPSFGTAWA